MQLCVLFHGEQCPCVQISKKLYFLLLCATGLSLLRGRIDHDLREGSLQHFSYLYTKDSELLGGLHIPCPYWKLSGLYIHASSSGFCHFTGFQR